MATVATDVARAGLRRPRQPPREGHVAYPWGRSFSNEGRSAGVCYGTVMVVPSPIAVMENVPAVLDV